MSNGTPINISNANINSIAQQQAQQIQNDKQQQQQQQQIQLQIKHNQQAAYLQQVFIKLILLFYEFNK